MLAFANIAAAVSFLLALSFAIIPLVPAWIFLITAQIAFGAVKGFASLNLSSWVLIGLATLILIALDWLGPQMGTLRAGGSKYAIIGASIGAFIGPFIFTPLVGIFVGPALGAMAGEFLYVQRIKKLPHAVKVGLASLLGGLYSTLIKVFIVAGTAIFFYKIHS